ncbi:MAG TPA: amidohydrolase [Flavisolibacter sp.]|nr:amidohydrolase [Flavisolibacter sp.]
MPDLNISLVQTHLHWEDKEANLKVLEQKINKIEAPAQVVVLPEMFPTGFSMKPELFAEKMDGRVMQWMKKIAAEKKIILTGSVIIEEEGKYFNRLIWMLPNGQCGHYDKRHLFAYGDEHLHYTPGNKRMIASVNGWKINLLVCYDLRFPVWSRQQLNEKKEFEYDVLIYVANWPERRNTAWKSLLQARAIENQAYVIGVNRVGIDGNNINHSGDSMAIGPLGEILYHNENREECFTIALNKEHLLQTREKFPFYKDADEFSLFI